LSELKTVGVAFVCTLCEKPLRSRFIPDTAPKCPNCGGDMRPTENTIRAEVDAFCSHCHYEGPAFESSVCPKCGSQFNGLPGKRPEADKVAPTDYPRVVKQGPSGGIRARVRKTTA
jgi:hypothetical protein